MSILKQIFDGDYYPSEQIVPQSEEYKYKRTACNIALSELEQVLGSEDAPALTRFLDIHAEEFAHHPEFALVFLYNRGSTKFVEGCRHIERKDKKEDLLWAVL